MLKTHLPSIWYGLFGKPYFLAYSKCRNLSLGLVTKARAREAAGQEWSSGVIFHALESVGECEGMNFTLPSELPLWELESQWTLESSEGHLRDQNSLHWKVPYTLEKLLKLRCLKWARMTHLYLKHKLWPKEGLGVKLPIWLHLAKLACDIQIGAPNHASTHDTNFLKMYFNAY